MQPDSPAGRDQRLSDLVNPEALSNACERFRALVGIDLLVLDIDGGILHGRPNDVEPPAASASEKYARFRAGEATYLRARVDNQMEPLGSLVLGPLPAPADGVQRIDAERALQFLCTVLEEIAFANYQSSLTAKMSFETTRNQFGELLDREAELGRLEETLRDSRELRSLF